MRDAAKKFEFEKAAELRDRIKMLKSFGVYEESQASSAGRRG
jgi:protein-arginine kinase activator protein McsA